MKNNPSQPSLIFKGRGLKDRNQAFTLVELIVVITILAILGTIAFISLQGYSRDARDSTRTADLGNMKTSLELYSLKTGNYPKPDNFSTITYSGGAVWYQGIVGDQVTTNLKSLNEKPLDPLTKSPYTYSVTQSKGEYEVLVLYEGSVAYNSIINNANAATASLTPKVVGNYNGVFVKTTAYIIPTPSIITAELLLSGNPLTLTPTNIRSQVITNGTNIPKNNLSSAQTGGLTGFNLAVFTGSITKNSPKAKKVEVITQIQHAYTGATNLNTKQNISYILNQTSTGQIVALTDITILKGHSSLTSNTYTNTTPTLPSFTCGTDTVSAGGETYTTILGRDGKCWTSQNMRHGTMLANGPTMPSNPNVIEKWCYNNDPNICTTDGGLYTWAEAMGFNPSCNTTSCPQAEDTIKSVCGQLGAGWHLPSDAQWTALTTAGATGWTGNKLSGIVSSIPGFRWTINPFHSRYIYGYRWSSLEVNATNLWNRSLSSVDATVGRASDGKNFGSSLVCIKN